MLGCSKARIADLGTDEVARILARDRAAVDDCADLLICLLVVAPGVREDSITPGDRVRGGEEMYFCTSDT